MTEKPETSDRIAPPPSRRGIEPIEEAREIDAVFRERSWERERQFRAALTSGAAYLTLMTTAALQANRGLGSASADDTVRTAQFFLTVLAALVIRYATGSIRGLTEAIVDDAARMHELERDHPEMGRAQEVRIAEQNAQLRRANPALGRLPRWVSASIPRAGKSQRQAVVLGALIAAIPAAWFSLAPSHELLLDLAVITAVGACVVAWVRLLFVGAKHWVWVDPATGELVRLPSVARPPKWWWRKRLSNDTTIAAVKAQLRDDQTREMRRA